MRPKTPEWVQYVFVVLSPSRGKRLSSKVEVANLLGTQLQCGGHERHFLDCPSDFTSINGQTLTTCPDQDSLVLMCNPGALIDPHSNKINNIRGFPYVSIDLEVWRSKANIDTFLLHRGSNPRLFGFNSKKKVNGVWVPLGTIRFHVGKTHWYVALKAIEEIP